MNLSLLSIFVKDCRESKTAQTRTKCAAAASGIGIASNALLSVMKLVIGIITGSIAITADAVNNIADASSSVITLIGFKLASKPADKEHPYGHQRIEYLTGLIVSLVICVLGVEFFTNSVSTLMSGDTTVYSTVSLIILAVSIAIKLWQSMFYRTVGNHIESPALIAASQDSRNDTISTSAVLIGALISRFFGIDLDGWLGLAVACFIIRSGVMLVMETSSPLLGNAPTAEFVESIGKRIMSYEGVLGYHDLMVHNYGHDRIYASVHAEVPAERDILISHDIIDNIEFDFKRDGIHLVIHLDPVITCDDELSELKREIDALVKIAAAEYGCDVSIHDFRVVRGRTHTNLIFDAAVPFECTLTDSEIKEDLARRVRTLSEKYNAVIDIDRSYV